MKKIILLSRLNSLIFSGMVVYVLITGMINALLHLDEP